MKSFLKSLVPKRVKDSLSYFPGKEQSIISFSQEGEDILLHRIFERQKMGFYVDVGAHHPFRFSNTAMLYRRGWKGICIEPNPDLKIPFETSRPRDVFVNSGVALNEGKLGYYKYQDPAYNTFMDDVVDSRIDVKPIGVQKIRTQRLDSILSKYMKIGQSFDLLTIDVEGMDLAVLQSNDWSKFKPTWIICEEITPGISGNHDSEIHLFLKEKGYSWQSKLFKSVFFKREE